MKGHDLASAQAHLAIRQGFETQQILFNHMIKFLCCAQSPSGANRSTVNLLHLNLPYALFSTSCVLSRTYNAWVNLAKRHGFTPAEVLEASALGAYVVVDPMNKTSLLALSPMAYQKLLGQTMSTENLNLVLLLSPLDELVPSAAEASPSNQNSPIPGRTLKFSFQLDSFVKKVQEGRFNMNARKPTWSRGYPFQGYQGILGKISDGRLILDATNFSGIFQRWASRLHFWSGSSRGRRFRSALWVFLKHLGKILKHSGPFGLALYLKGSYLIVLRYVAGQPFVHSFSQSGVPIKLSNGLPQFLPREWRAGIRRGHPRLLRIILSLLYSYKAFKATKPKSTALIFANVELPPLMHVPMTSFSEFVPRFLSKRISPLSEGELTPSSLPASLKAGPNGPLSALAYGADAYAWIQREEDANQPSVPGPLEWIRHFGFDKWDKKVRDYARWFSERGFNHTFNVTFPPPVKRGWYVLKTKLALGLNVPEAKTIELNPKFAFTRREVSYTPTRVEDMDLLKSLGKFLPVGRVHVLWEAAGKTRVIAMMDGIRQALLKPLHLAMFRRIDRCFGDLSGIYNQGGAVRSFAARLNRKVFSYDISAATDTIPWQLYIPQMSFLLGDIGANLWIHLVRSHPFLHIKRECGVPWAQSVADSLAYYYGRGQPMGGYSSFAALDMLHHLIVQYSAFEAGYETIDKTYDNYRILGDDVVIGDEEVAKTYLYFMKEWNVPISENKSFVSKSGFFQFLSEVFKFDTCLSPLSLKNDFQAITFLERFSFAASAVNRGWGTALAMEGYGRLILNKDQFLIANTDARVGKASAFIYSLLYALVTFVGDGGWGVGKWLYNVVAHDPSPQLRGHEADLSPLEQSFVTVLLRKVLYSEWVRISSLQKAESEIHQTRQFLDFGSIEFHNDLENEVDSLWLLGQEGKTLLASADVSLEWFNSAFAYLRKTMGLGPRLSTPGVIHPLDYLVLQKTMEERNNLKKLQNWTAEKASDEDIFRVQLVDLVFGLLKNDPYYHEVLSGTSSPYGLAVMPVPEEGRPSGNS